MTFHLYGFIIAIAIFIAVSLIEIKSKKFGIKEKEFWNLVFWILLFGIIGARAWHVITDLHLYINNFWGIFKVWNGGLSILGAIAGGILAVLFRSKNKLFVILDLAIFGLPFGQAIGRLANYFNQELYGLPTNLPWGIYINPEFRIHKFKNFNYFHPLFAYEALAMLAFGLTVWQVEKLKKYKIGSGKYFLSYLIYYSIIRFLLDFLRVYNQPFFNTGLTRNQFILILFWIVGLSYWFLKKYKKSVR